MIIIDGFPTITITTLSGSHSSQKCSPLCSESGFCGWYPVSGLIRTGTGYYQILV